MLSMPQSSIRSAKFGDATDWVRAEKQRRERREPLPNTPPVPGSLRWYGTLYRRSDRWLGDAAIGEEGLAESTRDARTGLIEPLLGDNGATAHELMAIFGSKDIKEAEVYTRAADRKQLAAGAMAKLER